MSLSSFLSSFLTVVHNDAPEEKDEDVKEEEPKEEEGKVEESAESEEAEGGAEAEEEEEPEDIHPALREECQNSSKCAPLTKHFQHCQEKIEAGEGYKGEDCVEELMMHCVDGCVAPKLFGKLR